MGTLVTPNALSLVRACFPGASYALPDESFEVIISERVASHVGLYWRSIATEHGELSVGGIGLVCTHPQWRGLGLATSLLEAASRRASLHQCQGLVLFAGDAEGRWYETRGFTRRPEVPHLYATSQVQGRVTDTLGLW